MADSFLNKSGVSHLWEKIKAALGDKADKSTTVAGYGITNAYTKTEVDTKVNAKADSATTLSGYGINNAYTKTEVNNSLLAKENTSNKVSSWQSTTDDTHYPSEKLVKTALDGKANSSHTHTKSQITDFPSSMPASDVYSWAKASSKPSYSTSEISGLQTALDGKVTVSDLLSKVYPVGSVYLSINNTSPASFLGGNWEMLAANYALWTATSNAGTTIAAGLPNITGYLQSCTHDSNPDDGKLFTNSNYETANIAGSKGYYKLSRHNFNASKSNSIYGNSSIVQPPAYKIYAWKRIS